MLKCVFYLKFGTLCYSKKRSAGDSLLNFSSSKYKNYSLEHCISSSTQRTVKTAHWKVQAYLPFIDTEFMSHSF